MTPARRGRVPSDEPVEPAHLSHGSAPVTPAGREPLRSVVASGVRGPVRLALLVLIRLYQLAVSPLLGPVCRFYPSCSNYGFEAVRVHGAVRGGWLTVRRLARCHPWNPGGVDHVPGRAEGHELSHERTGTTCMSVRPHLGA